MGEGELAIRLAAMVSLGCVLLSRIVWRDQARYDDGWLIAIGYAVVVSASISIWTNFWAPTIFIGGSWYRWRREQLEEE